MTMRVDSRGRRQGAQPPEISRQVDAEAPRRRRRARRLVVGLAGLAMAAGFGGGLFAGLAFAPTRVVHITHKDVVNTVGPCTYAAPPATAQVQVIDEPQPQMVAEPDDVVFAKPPCCYLNRGCFQEVARGQWAENPCTVDVLTERKAAP